MKAFRSLLILLIVAAIGILGAQWLGQQPARDIGEVIVRAGGNDYIATLPQATLAALIALIVLWMLWSLASAPFRAWGNYRSRRGRTRLSEGLQALDYGHWQRAEKLLDAAAEDTDVRTLALIAAMRAAEARADNAAAGRYLERLAGDDPTAHALHSAERWLAQDRPVEAINALDVAAAQPLPPRGLWLRTEALALAGRADEAYGQLGALRQQQILSSDALNALEARLAAQSLQEASDVNALAARWEILPKPLRISPPIVAAYAHRAIILGWEEPALRSLEQTLDEHWDEATITLYGTLHSENPDARQASTQRWLALHPTSAGLLLTLARQAIRQQQWAVADDHLQRAIAEGAGADAWELSAEVFTAQGEEALARQCLQNALRHARNEPLIAWQPRHRATQPGADASTHERDDHSYPRLAD